jgi:hypothetical protein
MPQENLEKIVRENPKGIPEGLALLQPRERGCARVITVAAIAFLGLAGCDTPSASRPVPPQPPGAHSPELSSRVVTEEAISQALSKRGEIILVRVQERERTIIVDNVSTISVLDAPCPNANVIGNLSPGSRVRSNRSINVEMIVSQYKGRENVKLLIEAYEVENFGYVIRFIIATKGLSATTEIANFQVLNLDPSVQNQKPGAKSQPDEQSPAIKSIEQSQAPNREIQTLPPTPRPQLHELQPHSPPAPEQEKFIDINHIASQIAPYVEARGFKLDHHNDTSAGVERRRLLINPIPGSQPEGYIYRPVIGHLYLRRESDNKLFVIGVITKATEGLTQEQIEKLEESPWSIAFTTVVS